MPGKSRHAEMLETMRMWPRPARSHVAAEQGAQQRRRDDVELQHRGGARGVGVDGLAEEEEAGVVDEDVDLQAEGP
jgi:hypothetical protein